jgi:hypothetical protein
MTEREAMFFLQGIQFAFGACEVKGLSDIYLSWGLQLSLEVIKALNIDFNRLEEGTAELHVALDRGGFRGEEQRIKANQ